MPRYGYGAGIYAVRRRSLQGLVEGEGGHGRDKARRFVAPQRARRIGGVHAEPGRVHPRGLERPQAGQEQRAAQPLPYELSSGNTVIVRLNTIILS